MCLIHYFGSLIEPRQWGIGVMAGNGKLSYEMTASHRYEQRLSATGLTNHPRAVRNGYESNGGGGGEMHHLDAVSIHQTASLSFDWNACQFEIWRYVTVSGNMLAGEPQNVIIKHTHKISIVFHLLTWTCCAFQVVSPGRTIQAWLRCIITKKNQQKNTCFTGLDGVTIYYSSYFPLDSSFNLLPYMIWICESLTHQQKMVWEGGAGGDKKKFDLPLLQGKKKHASRCSMQANSSFETSM